MNRMTLLLMLITVLSGCAVCETHPTACKVVAVSAGVIVMGLAVQHHSTAIEPTRSQIPSTPNCAKPGTCN